ncbi:hypothetical protein GCM10011591_09950 [Nocardia camponoti]|uniref:Uncharacterized protein n=1 Tax=Nocardia camponoti TaxID=1616106 RepID=A0A917QBD5_9NOCA|nr:hypothetical protein GCM10011591_09950 [Nocardia camponoti]
MIVENCAIDVPEGYSLNIHSKITTCPTPIADTSAGIAIRSYNPYIVVEGKGTLAPHDDAEPTFQSCSKNTRYTQSVQFRAGSAVCFIGNQTVALITTPTGSAGKYTPVVVTIWAA